MKRRSEVKIVLMNQVVVAGLGNIYVIEALWLSRISPFRVAKSLNIQEVENLTQAIRNVLKLAIEAGGSSVQNFRTVGGDIGYFQHNFNAYNRYGKECKNSYCSGKIERVKQGGRATYYCESCQT